MQVRISARSNKGKTPERLIETANQVAHEATEPKGFKDALSSTDSKKWTEAMDAEMQSLELNIFSLVQCKYTVIISVYL